MDDRHRTDAPASLDDESTLRKLGYQQELARRMSGFSNLAISLSIICILAGGLTSFHQGLCGIGGAAYGIGWPLVAVFSTIVALTMGHLASAFPTAGGLYHWAAILGGPGWGWATAWFNLLGLVVVLAAINLGAVLFAIDAFGGLPAEWSSPVKLGGMALVTLSQAAINHRGIRVTTRLTDLSGWLILLVSVALVAAMLAFAPAWDFSRLFELSNFSGAAGGNVWPETTNLTRLFLLGLLLPAYTLTGFDASAHTAEETVGAAHNVPRAIWRSVVLSAVAGWVLLCAIIVAAPDLAAAAATGPAAFFTILKGVVPAPLASALIVGILACQYLCGLATVTSASRMIYAFARDGGLPFSSELRQVSPRHRVPARAIWTAALIAIAFTLYTPVYENVAACCAILLYISYVLPTAIGVLAHGRSWKRNGPWSLGRGFRPLGVVAVTGCIALIAIGVQPPNDKVATLVGSFAGLLALAWYGGVRRRFAGPPRVV